VFLKGRSQLSTAPANAFLCVCLVFGWLLAYPDISAACSFHNYKPAKTLVDWVLYSNTVALARPDPDNPFRYEVTQVYRGEAGDTEIPFLVDSVSRRRLANNPGDGVLLVQAGGNKWTLVRYIDADNRELLNLILENTAAWRAEPFHQGRFWTAADYQDHPDTGLRRFALQEIDRVPYAMLRTLAVRIPQKELLSSLASVNEYAYRPINFLLLGLIGNDTARSFINKQITLMQTGSSAEQLGAVATALIELEGIHGIEKLDRLYLSDPSQPLEKIEAIVEAFAIHNGFAPDALQREIRKTLITLVDRRPDGAAAIARQFSARRDWSFGPYLEAALKTQRGLLPSTRLVASVYVAQSRVALGD